MSWASGNLWNVINDISSMRTVTGMAVSVVSVAGYICRERTTASPLLVQAEKALDDICTVLGSLSHEQQAQIAEYQLREGHYTIEDLEDRYRRLRNEYNLHKFEYNNATRWQRWWMFSVLCSEMRTLIHKLTTLSDDVYRTTTYPTHLRFEDRRMAQHAESAEKRAAQKARLLSCIRRLAARIEKAGTELDLVPTGNILPLHSGDVARVPSAHIAQAQYAAHTTARSAGYMPMPGGLPVLRHGAGRGV